MTVNIKYTRYILCCNLGQGENALQDDLGYVGNPGYNIIGHM